eukprot:scaffold25584_cov129-Isochrysis_galbana.AAC.2
MPQVCALFPQGFAHGGSGCGFAQRGSVVGGSGGSGHFHLPGMPYSGIAGPVLGQHPRAAYERGMGGSHSSACRSCGGSGCGDGCGSHLTGMPSSCTAGLVAFEPNHQ